MANVPRLTGSTPGGFDTFYSVGKKLFKRGARNVKKQWDVLHQGGVCTGCSLGMCGDTDELGDFHLCYQGMKRLEETAYPPIADGLFGDIAGLRAMSTKELSTLGRVTYPLIYREGDAGFARLTWEEALHLVTLRLAACPPDQMAFYMSGRSSNEAIYITQLFARLLGTNNIDNCSRYCHAPSTYGLAEVFGKGSGTSSLSDIDAADLIFIIGSNMPSQHPRLLKNIGAARKRGAEIVIVNPVVERGLLRYAIPSDFKSTFAGTDIASRYIQPKVGGDIAFLMAILKVVKEQHKFDRDFLGAHTEGWDAFENALDALDLMELADASGVSLTDIQTIATLYARADRALTLYCMGLTHHSYGTDNVRMVANFMLARGMVGKPGTGVVPIRGHSNVQGAGEMMMVPTVTDTMRERMRDRYGDAIPAGTGMTTSEMVHAAHDGRMKLAYLVGGNLVEASPQTEYTVEAFRKIPTIVSQTIHLNRTHLVGNPEMIILPAQPRHEQEGGGSIISNWRQVRFSPKILPTKGESRPEWKIPLELAKLLGDNDADGRFTSLKQLRFSSVRALQEEIAAVIPGYEELPGLAVGKTFQVGDTSLHRGGIFATANGKARVATVTIPDTAVPDGAYQMISVRADGQFNTEITDDVDKLRQASSRDIVLMSQKDADALGCVEGTPVRVWSEVGEMHVHTHIYDIRPGVVAMYFPEANVLIPWHGSDADTYTPNFKGATVRIEKAQHAA